MLKNIYSSLDLAILVLIVVYSKYTIITIIKVKHDKIGVVKTRIVSSSAFLLLIIIKMIIALLLGKSIVSELVCAILWAICMVIGWATLKEAKRIANFEFHIMPDLDENIIDVKYKIIDEDNK